MTTHFHEGADPSRAYYGTDARASQLLVGALLALLLLHWNPTGVAVRVALQWLAAAAAIGIAYAFVTTNDRGAFLYHGGFLAFAVCTAIVIAAIVQTTRNPLRSGLASRPSRWIGQISYGIYLWHWPIAVSRSTPLVPASPAGSWRPCEPARRSSIAALSYYLVELPIRQRRFLNVWTPRLALPAAAGFTIAVLLIATVGATAPNPLAGRPGTVLGTERSADEPPIVVSADAPTRRTLLLGDSVAFSLGDALARGGADNEGSTSAPITRLGWGLTTGVALTEEGDVVTWSPGVRRRHTRLRRRQHRGDEPDAVVWLSTWELSSYEVDGKTLIFGTKAFDDGSTRN